MAKKRRRLGKLLYILCLLFWCLLLCWGAWYCLGRVWIYAEEYELSRPNHTMDAYVSELSRNLWDQGIEDTIRAMPHEVQSDEEVAEHVRKMLSSGVSYLRKGGGGEGRAIYSLRCSGHEFGTVTIVEEENYESRIDTGVFPWNLLPWSIRPWRVESESFDFNGLYSSVSVVVPRTYTVMLNGVKLGQEYVVETDIPFDALKGYYERHDGLPKKQRYRFDNVIGTIEPVILDENGEVFPFDPARDDTQFFKGCTPERLERLGKFTAGFVDRYLRYTSGAIDPTYGYQRLGPYLLKGSDLDERMKSAIDGLSWAHTSSVTVKSAQLNGAVSLGENYYICDITSEATAFTPGKGETESVSNMRVIVRERNDDYRALLLELK